MFSDNQALHVSGSFDDIQSALEFALSLSGDEEDFKDHSCECVFQKTDDGGFTIGWLPSDRLLKNTASYEPGEGWNRFPFEYDANIISQIIVQYLQMQKADPKEVVYYSTCDGSVEKGFLMEAVNYGTAGLTDPGHGIVIFHTHANFYAK